MDEISVKIAAKVNLGLDILEKRKDNYHNIQTIMHSIDIHDKLVFKKSNKLKITCNNEDVPMGKENIVYQCVKKISNIMGNEDKLLDVKIDKFIPISAGLGGGSANGAATLIAYNKLYNLGLTKDELCDIATEIGADIPFLIHSGCAFCEGIGEKIKKLYPIIDMNMVLCKPDFGVSTAEAYNLIDKYGVREKPDFDDLLHGLLEKDKEKLNKGLINVFEPYVLKKYPKIKEIKDKFISYNAKGVQMSGSGPSVFALFTNKDDAIKAYEEMKKEHSQVYITKLIDDKEALEIE